MRDSVYNFSLDLHEVASQIQITMRQGDTARTLRVQLVEDGKPYVPGRHTHVELSATRPDEEPVLHDASIDLLSGVIIYNMPGNFITGVAGLVECEFIVYDEEDNVLASPRFTILVSDRAIDPGDITSNDQFTTLQTALAEAEAAKPVVLECTAADSNDEMCDYETATKLTNWKIDALDSSVNDVVTTVAEAWAAGKPCRIICHTEVASNDTHVRLRDLVFVPWTLVGGFAIVYMHISQRYKDAGNVLMSESKYCISMDIETKQIGFYSNRLFLADLTDDESHRTVSDAEKSTWSGKQDKINNLGSIIAGANLGATSEQKSNKVTSIDDTSTHLTYPSTKAVYDEVSEQVGDLQSDTEAALALKANTSDVEAALVNKADYSALANYLSKNDAADTYARLDHKTNFDSESRDYYPSSYFVHNELRKKLDNPTNTGSTGQVLTKTATGAAWADAQGGGGLPEGGTEGQVIMMGEEEAEWADLADVATSGSYNDLSNKPDLTIYAESEDLAAVATSGSYNDLSNKPTIPTVPANVSAFNNDAGYLTTHQPLTAYRTAVQQDAIDAVKIDNPTGGTAGQVLTKTANGEAWDDAALEIPVTKDGTRTYVSSTDYAKIEAAWAAGRTMTLLYENRRYYPMRAGDGSAQQDSYAFYALDPGDDPIWEPEDKLHTITIISPGSAAVSDITLEKLGNKVTAISSSSTNAKYPSAKAVYDLVEERTTHVFSATMQNNLAHSDTGVVPAIQALVEAGETDIEIELTAPGIEGTLPDAVYRLRFAGRAYNIALTKRYAFYGTATSVNNIDGVVIYKPLLVEMAFTYGDSNWTYMEQYEVGGGGGGGGGGTDEPELYKVDYVNHELQCSYDDIMAALLAEKLPILIDKEQEYIRILPFSHTEKGLFVFCGVGDEPGSWVRCTVSPDLEDLEDIIEEIDDDNTAIDACCSYIADINEGTQPFPIDQTPAVVIYNSNSQINRDVSPNKQLHLTLALTIVNNRHTYDLAIAYTTVEWERSGSMNGVNYTVSSDSNGAISIALSSDTVTNVNSVELSGYMTYYGMTAEELADIENTVTWDYGKATGALTLHATLETIAGVTDIDTITEDAYEKIMDALDNDVDVIQLDLQGNLLGADFRARLPLLYHADGEYPAAAFGATFRVDTSTAIITVFVEESGANFDFTVLNAGE